MKDTIPEVFIVESLRFHDEEKGYYEGQIISDILRLNKKQSKYYYIRTKKELRAVLDKFRDSNYRYLHLSCHKKAWGSGLGYWDLVSSIKELVVVQG